MSNATLLKIEKAIAVPSRGGMVKYDWSSWEVGDSAVFPTKKRVMVLRSGKDYLKSKGMTSVKFITRAVEEGTRIWLVNIEE